MLKLEVKKPYTPSNENPTSEAKPSTEAEQASTEPEQASTEPVQSNNETVTSEKQTTFPVNRTEDITFKPKLNSISEEEEESDITPIQHDKSIIGITAYLDNELQDELNYYFSEEHPNKKVHFNPVILVGSIPNENKGRKVKKHSKLQRNDDELENVNLNDNNSNSQQNDNLD